MHIYQQLNLKDYLSKQEEQGQNHGYGGCFHGCQMGEECGGMGEELGRLRSINR